MLVQPAEEELDEIRNLAEDEIQVHLALEIDGAHPITNRAHSITDGVHPITDGAHLIIDGAHPIELDRTNQDQKDEIGRACNNCSY